MRQLTDEEIRRKHRAMYGPKPCRVCGKNATIIEDEGWACDTHRFRDVDMVKTHQPMLPFD